MDPIEEVPFDGLSDVGLDGGGGGPAPPADPFVAAPLPGIPAAWLIVEPDLTASCFWCNWRPSEGIFHDRIQAHFAELREGKRDPEAVYRNVQDVFREYADSDAGRRVLHGLHRIWSIECIRQHVRQHVHADAYDTHLAEALIFFGATRAAAARSMVLKRKAGDSGGVLEPEAAKLGMAAQERLLRVAREIDARKKARRSGF